MEKRKEIYDSYKGVSTTMVSTTIVIIVTSSCNILTARWCFYDYPRSLRYAARYFVSRQWAFVLFFSIREKTKLSHNELVVHYLIFQFVVAISGVDFVTMIDDKLILDLSGKELITIALFWKQLTWKLPWKKYIEDGESVFSLLYGDILKIVEDWLF